MKLALVGRIRELLHSPHTTLPTKVSVIKTFFDIVVSNFSDEFIAIARKCTNVFNQDPIAMEEGELLNNLGIVYAGIKSGDLSLGSIRSVSNAKLTF